MFCIEKTLVKIQHGIAHYKRRSINKRMRKNLINRECTILSCNCTGGVISHDLGLRMNSPTINFFFMAEDYLRFLENMDYYLQAPITKAEIQNQPWLIANIGDIEAHLVHYNSIEDFCNAWNRRKQRINKDNIFLLWCDRDGFKEEMLGRFASLPYPKVFFSHKAHENCDFEVVLPEFANDDYVGILSDFIDSSGEKYYDKHFDVVRWLNGESVSACKK